MDKLFFRVSSGSFSEISGYPIAYWLSEGFYNVFKSLKPIGQFTFASEGVKSGNNDVFLRFWFEVGNSTCGSLHNDGGKWVYHHKGGQYRKWSGNKEYVILWASNGEKIKSMPNSGIQGEKAFLKNSAIWSDITSGGFSARRKDAGHVFDSASPSAFLIDEVEVDNLLGYLNSKVVSSLTPVLNPTLHFKVGNFRSLPFKRQIVPGIKRLVEISAYDWNSFETSWDFTTLQLLNTNHSEPNFKACYQKLRTHWSEMTLEMQRLEQENNRIFIDAYGLQDELTPEVPLNEITLTCNPHYRYGGDKTEEELEALLLTDTLREFVSYAVGCMFGRYALDKPGLVLANQGETIEDYRRQVPNSRFEADADNVIPMLDGEWFADDVTERFRLFLRVTFGDDHYAENLAFIEQALNPKGKRAYTLRDYMLGEFYADHVKRYKKRPIYWLFSSPKGTFNALIYLHRYRPDTASVVLRYLREFRAKLAARQSTLEQVLINPATSQGEKTKAVKEIDSLKKQIIELQDYENDTLYPLATANVALDLDDGVKVNYLKLGAALKKITGLDAKEED